MSSQSGVSAKRGSLFDLYMRDRALEHIIRIKCEESADESLLLDIDNDFNHSSQSASLCSP